MLLYSAHYGCLDWSMHPLNKALGSWKESRRAGQMDSAHAGQGWKSCDSNCRPWSVVMFCWHPLRDIHPDSRARATVSAVMSSREMASGQRVKRSTAVRQYLKPSDVGSGPTTSMCKCWNRDVGRAKSPSGVVVCLDIFDRRQV